MKYNISMNSRILMDAFNEAVQEALKAEQYHQAQVFSTAEDLTDAIFKMHPEDPLAMLQRAFTHNESITKGIEAGTWQECLEILHKFN
jgi:hypothetical protein